jgi:murein DD-endopeptidase MepM/ murein hydrolase activator NlpD
MMKNTLICLGLSALLWPLASNGQFHTLGKGSVVLLQLEQDSLMMPRKTAMLITPSIHINQTTVLSNVSLPLRGIMVTSPKGIRKHPVHGNINMHNGIDLRAHYDSVFSILDGIIQDAGYDHRSGRWIRIAHPGGLVSTYAHLSNILVTIGQSIRSGECIGITGNSGSSTAPHLHFTLKK